jgi:hypothetical protein
VELLRTSHVCSLPSLSLSLVSFLGVGWFYRKKKRRREATGSGWSPGNPGASWLMVKMNCGLLLRLEVLLYYSDLLK